MDFGVDGFRIDTVKHVNIEFWQDWCAAIVQHARETGKHHFFMFGEVYSFEPAELSYFMRKSQMDSVLDFAFQNHVTAFASGAPGARLHKLFDDDAFYLTPRTAQLAPHLLNWRQAHWPPLGEKITLWRGCGLLMN